MQEVHQSMPVASPRKGFQQRTVNIASIPLISHSGPPPVRSKEIQGPYRTLIVSGLDTPSGILKALTFYQVAVGVSQEHLVDLKFRIEGRRRFDGRVMLPKERLPMATLFRNQGTPYS